MSSPTVPAKQQFMSIPHNTGTLESMNTVINVLVNNMNVLVGVLQTQPGALGAGVRYQQPNAPAIGYPGDTWINTTTNVLYYWGSAGWTPTTA